MTSIDEYAQHCYPSPETNPALEQFVNSPNLDELLEQRGSQYGAFTGHAEVTQRLKRVLNDELRKRGKVLADDQMEALEMTFHKIGRIVNGNPDHVDGWLDASGYCKLVADRLGGVVR